MAVHREGPGLLPFARRVELGWPEAVGTLAAMLLVEIKTNLQKPGQGRWYPKRRVHGKGPLTPLRVAKTRALNRARREAARDLNTGSLTLDRITKRDVLTGLHRASKPGDSPAADTGNLLRSTFLERVSNAFLVGVAAATGRWLEFGVPGRILPRPFMRPAARTVQEKSGVTLTRVLRQFQATRGG